MEIAARFDRDRVAMWSKRAVEWLGRDLEAKGGAALGERMALLV